MTTQEGWAMVPADPSQAYKMAEYISQSGLCPNDYKNAPQKVMVAAAMGAKLGLDVFASMAGIAVVNGRPSIWGDALRALVLAHPHLENIEEKYEGEGDNLTAVCIITRKGMSPYEATFSVADAKEAGLWGRNTWKNFAKDMLLNRAFGRAARRRFADALNGLHCAEEMQDATPQLKTVKRRSDKVIEPSATFSIEEKPTEEVESVNEAEWTEEPAVDEAAEGATE